jgi:hypothetical protein
MASRAVQRWRAGVWCLGLLLDCCLVSFKCVTGRESLGVAAGGFPPC